MSKLEFLTLTSLEITKKKKKREKKKIFCPLYIHCSWVPEVYFVINVTCFVRWRDRTASRRKDLLEYGPPKKSTEHRAPQKKKMPLRILLVLELRTRIYTHRCAHTHTETKLIQKMAERKKKKISPGNIACFTTNYQRLRSCIPQNTIPSLRHIL